MTPNDAHLLTGPSLPFRLSAYYLLHSQHPRCERPTELVPVFFRGREIAQARLDEGFHFDLNIPFRLAQAIAKNKLKAHYPGHLERGEGGESLLRITRIEIAEP